MSDDSGDGDGVSVESGLVESLMDDLIELAISSSGEEGVELGDWGGTWMRVLRQLLEVLVVLKPRLAILPPRMRSIPICDDSENQININNQFNHPPVDINMFFELEDVKRRHNPSWWTNNVTAWHAAVDSTPSWNYQRGLFIGLISATAQQYLSHFILHARAMFQHYEPPVGVVQWWNFIKQTQNLDSFRHGLKSRMQLGTATAALSVAPQIALLRQFNSGWSCNFGGFEYSYYRKVPTFFAAFALSAPLSVALDMASRAYYSDKTFPKQLQKGYKSFLDAARRIPFEQGPYYLLKNTFPLFIKHSVGPFTAFYCYDWLIDKFSVLWRASNMPVLPIVLFCATFGTYLGAAFTYPFAVTAREMVDIWPKKGGVDPFGGNYRKAAVYIWFSQNIVNYYPGFFKRYFWHIAPQWFLSILLAEKLGIFKYWRIDIFAGAADNSPEDSFV